MKRHLQIIGILNVTPDSYFDGGRYATIDSVVKRVGDMVKNGADIIEIGGESTGPGSVDVPVSEEMNRIKPVLIAIREAYPDVRVSVDTYKSEIADAVLSMGASMINDVTAGRGDPEMFSVVARSNADLVIMFSKDETARTTVHENHYNDVIKHVKTFLSNRMTVAENAGVAVDRIILDPGMGHFVSSDPLYSFEIIARLGDISELGCPLLISPSRKSFLSGEEGLGPNERLPGTIASSAIAVMQGASYIRTHDVSDVRRGCDAALNILRYLH